MMDCRAFEQELESLTSGALPAARRQAAEQHVAGCAECGELLALALLPVEVEAGQAEVGFVEAVVAQTSGAPCAGAAQRLPALIEGSLEANEHALVASHVANCAECRDLVVVLGALARALPDLSEQRPDAHFVDDVLKKTLPVNVQLRRWRSRAWSRWLHRPRFASELAYIGSLVLVLVVATPGSPLEAVPRRALAVVSQPVTVQLDLEAYLAAPVDAVQALAKSPGAERLGGWIAGGVERAGKADEVVDGAAEGLATFWRGAASLMGSDGAEAAVVTPETPEKNEESP